MTPKEKAKELVFKYDETLTYLESKAKAKQCALIAVDETINGIKQYLHQMYQQQDMTPNEYTAQALFMQYYKNVKEEIEKL